MPGTGIVQGEIQYLGTIHGGTAINTIVFTYDSPDEWEFKQFVSQQQLDEFAAKHCLVVTRKEG